MSSAAVCLLVEGNMPEGIFLPSKFADYIQSRKPVIALSPATGTIADLLPANGVTQVQVDSPSAIEAAIVRYYEAFASGQIASLQPDETLVQQYDGARIGRVLRNLCAELAVRSPI
jgi:hypothetical protein